MKALLDYWENLAARERALLGVGSLFLVIALSYVFLWEPWNTELQRLKTQVPEKQRTLAWIESQTKLVTSIKRMQKPKTPIPKVPLLTAIETTAVRSKIKPFIKRIQPGKEKQVKIWLSDVLFDDWLIWIENLKNQDIEVVAATINRSNANKVSITVTLQQTG